MNLNEITGDEKFDGMMGKIAGNLPAHHVSAKVDRVQDKSENPPDETINALNKMMYDLHKAMQEADLLMRKLTGGG